MDGPNPADKSVAALQCYTCDALDGSFWCLVEGTRTFQINLEQGGKPLAKSIAGGHVKLSCGNSAFGVEYDVQPSDILLRFSTKKPIKLTHDLTFRISLFEEFWTEGFVPVEENFPLVFKKDNSKPCSFNKPHVDLYSSFGAFFSVSFQDESKNAKKQFSLEPGNGVCDLVILCGKAGEMAGDIKLAIQCSKQLSFMPRPKTSFLTEEKEKLKVDGYIHIPGLVPKSLCETLVRCLNHQMGLEFLNQTLRDHEPENPANKKKANTGHTGNYFPSLKHSHAVMDIFNLTSIPHLLENLLGNSNLAIPRGAQFALRHPTTEMTPVMRLAQKCSVPISDNFTKEEYHIDGNNPRGKPKGSVNNFTLLLGVILKDLPEEDRGNLIVYPGTHVKHANRFKEIGPESFFQGEGMPSWFVRDPDLPAPRQICGLAGDVVLCHYMLGHTVAPNCYMDTRYQIYFRVHAKSLKQSKLKSMVDPWLDWRGMKELVEEKKK